MLMRSADRHRPPTIYDVAETAGVSHTTVSRAVNGEGGMTEETRRRVLEVVARVGYEPNTAARVLAGRIRPRLAAVVEEGRGHRRRHTCSEASRERPSAAAMH